MIDFHCHLDLYPKPGDVVARCLEKGLYVLSVTTVPSAFEGTLALAPANGRIRTALGLHPELAATRTRELPMFEKLLPKTRYVGEVGLDGSKPHRDTLDAQKGVLNDLLGMCAAAGGRVISLHSRGATGQTLDVLSARANAGTFVLHWFVGSRRDVQRAVGLGCWFSVNPTMFASERARVAIVAMPKDRIVPESDGPFARVGDQPIWPWGAWLVVPKLAAIWGESEESVTRRLTKSFKTLVSR